MVRWRRMENKFCCFCPLETQADSVETQMILHIVCVWPRRLSMLSPRKWTKLELSLSLARFECQNMWGLSVRTDELQGPCTWNWREVSDSHPSAEGHMAAQGGEIRRTQAGTQARMLSFSVLQSECCRSTLFCSQESSPEKESPGDLATLRCHVALSARGAEYSGTTGFHLT
jgi:hypothetical protein